MENVIKSYREHREPDNRVIFFVELLVDDFGDVVKWRVRYSANGGTEEITCSDYVAAAYQFAQHVMKKL